MKHPGLELSLFGTKTGVAPPSLCSSSSSGGSNQQHLPMLLPTGLQHAELPLLLLTQTPSFSPPAGPYLPEQCCSCFPPMPPCRRLHCLHCLGCLRTGIPCTSEGIPLFPYSFPSPHLKPPTGSPAPQAMLTRTSQDLPPAMLNSPPLQLFLSSGNSWTKTWFSMP